MADEKYTHKNFASPGGPDPSVDAPEVSEYPKHLHGPKDSNGNAGETVIVHSVAEERAEMATGKWRLSPAEWEREAKAAAKAAKAANAAEGSSGGGAVSTAVGIVLLILALFAPAAHAQTSVSSTTLNGALAAPTQGIPATTVTLTSATGVVGPTATAPGTELFVDQEAMLVTSISGTVAQVIRGYDSSPAGAHNTAALVYLGPAAGVLGSPFVFSDPPIGACTAGNELYNLRINTRTGRLWQCTAGYWANVIDAFMFVPASYCQSSVSGNGTGTNGYTSIGTAPSLPVVQAQTSVTGTNTHYYQCSLIPDTSRLAAAKSVYIVDAEFYYGVQTTGLGTQVAVLASGTMNAKTVFSSITYPVPGAAETATGTAEAARADAGTLLITPVVASSNVATTTAGEFYSVKFTPATPLIVSTDHQQILLTVSLLNTATSATITNSPGVMVHYRLAQGL